MELTQNQEWQLSMLQGSTVLLACPSAIAEAIRAADSADQEKCIRFLEAMGLPATPVACELLMSYRPVKSVVPDQAAALDRWRAQCQPELLESMKKPKRSSSDRKMWESPQAYAKRMRKQSRRGDRR